MIKDIFTRIENQITTNDFQITDKDLDRPWGGFFVINESQAQEFSNIYFGGMGLDTSRKLSPKILVVKPKARLSWQYHHRRAEIWQIVEGTAGIVRSDSDEEKEMGKYTVGEQIFLKQGERHRLVGLNDYCVVAEIWQHTNTQNPSDENDIVRVQDDFGR